MFVNNQFMFRLDNSIKSKFFIILLSILKYRGDLELNDITDIYLGREEKMQKGILIGPMAIKYPSGSIIKTSQFISSHINEVK